MRKVALYIVALIAALPAFAEAPIVMKTLNVTASVPAPPWTEFAHIARDSETMRNKALSARGTDLFTRAYVPKGQGFETWDERYEVKAESPYAGDAMTKRDAFAAKYVQACENATMAPVLDQTDRQVFVLFCPAFLDAPDHGEIVIAVAEKRGDTLVQVNYLKKVRAFDIMDQSTLPKSHEEILNLVTYLNASHLLPAS